MPLIFGGVGSPMNRPQAVPALALLALLFTAAPGAAYTGGDQSVTHTFAMDGAQEVPGGSGDPDGTATGTLTLSSLAGLLSFSILFSNIDDPIALDIHFGAAGVEADPLVTLPVSDGVDPNPLIGTVALPDAILQSMIGDPTAFYVNLHTAAFPNGAVRGQVPEPGTAALLGAGLALLATLRRRARPASDRSARRARHALLRD